MVEFFAEKLDGVATTDNGWIISYGTRGYRPPIIYGDVVRPEPMTVEEISYAQSLTDKPVKGMLTGPVTIIAWSFVREDVPREDVAYQIALALQEEVSDYEDADIGMIQIDEPAFRELAPNKRSAWDDYFAWATSAFRLATAKALPETQIHTHMCYSEFNEIISYIQQMDFDVISIEATRSRGEVIGSFEEVNFDRQIGIGVYDIHSPAVPEESEIADVIRRSIQVIPKESFWINPDCGLKTRGWEETIPALKNMVNQARAFREAG
jgi:5-methyltetrahydropteroyltriglutamate--homocysteine methyltransferase